MLVKLTKSNVSLYLKYQKKHLKKKTFLTLNNFIGIIIRDLVLEVK